MKSERSANEHAQRDRARSIMRRELEWVRATPQARTGKSKSRLDAFKDLKARANVRLEEDDVRLDLDPARLGGKILELHRVRRAYGERVILDGWTYHFKPGERVGLVGDNGAGKSTLIRLITGEDTPDGGKVVIGDTVVFGHFSQEPPVFDEGMKVIEALYEIAEFMPLKKGKKLSAGQLLERFLFPRNRHHDFIHKLSGGERKRLHLLRVLMANPNFLVFDEPTNDLDVFTLGILEEFLLDFTGCLLLVSHDRYFMDKLVDHVFVLDGAGGVRDFPGNYTQYRTAADAEDKAAASQRAAEAKAESVPRSRRRPRRPERRLQPAPQLQRKARVRGAGGRDRRARGPQGRIGDGHERTGHRPRENDGTGHGTRHGHGRHRSQDRALDRARRTGLTPSSRLTAGQNRPRTAPTPALAWSDT